MLEPTRIDRLPQLVAHYRALGVERFLLALQTEPELPAAERDGHRARFAETLAALGIADASYLEQTYTAPAMAKHQAELQRQHATADDWIVWCDSDELQAYPAPLAQMAANAAAAGVEFLRGVLIDRIAADWSLPPFDPATPMGTTFPRTCFVHDAVAGSNRRKVAFARGDIRISGGHHHPVSDRPLTTMREWVQVHHFKWDASLIERLEFRLRPAFREACPWWVESKRMLDYYAAHGGRFDPADVEEIRIADAGLLTIAEH